MTLKILFRKILFRIETIRPLLRALRNVYRQNIDKRVVSWDGILKDSPFGAYTALLLGATLALCVAAALAAGATLAHLTRPPTGPYGPYVCLPANFAVINENPRSHLEDGDPFFPGRNASVRTTGSMPVYSAESSSRIVFFSNEHGPDVNAQRPAAMSPSQKQGKKGIVHFSKGRVSIETIDGSVFISPLRQAVNLPPAPSLDPIDVTLFTPPNASKDRLPSLLYGESLDHEGTPVRWAWRNRDFPQKTAMTCDFAEDSHAANRQRLLLGLGTPVPGAHYGSNPDKYHDYVSLYAEQYNLAASLMLAIMHTESNFNPLAVSSSQAVGLMQIVPDTAGNEVYRYLMGTHGTPSMETLFSPQYNIKYGAVYLHLLGRRYFAKVNNTASRQLCIIAAYNGGPNAVLRFFDPDPETALDRINALTPEQVYAALTTEMPYAETRRYVEIVLNRMKNYSAANYSN
ncbi:MAG: murein transglycosylase domain-containing protein [Desulfovibrio sp.]|jgi:membrane-bound lytic murein transglycosylase C|nr:murein transglycosylase domain-containing protein [Desulfovibrio sp.]